MAAAVAAHQLMWHIRAGFGPQYDSVLGWTEAYGLSRRRWSRLLAGTTWPTLEDIAEAATTLGPSILEPALQQWLITAHRRRDDTMPRPAPRRIPPEHPAHDALRSFVTDLTRSADRERAELLLYVGPPGAADEPGGPLVAQIAPHTLRRTDGVCAGQLGVARGQAGVLITQLELVGRGDDRTFTVRQLSPSLRETSRRSPPAPARDGPEEAIEQRGQLVGDAASPTSEFEPGRGRRRAG